jgi:hypothetical protein
MGTRANIVIREGKDKLIFYRHYDGYPEVVLPSLKRLTDGIVSGQLRNNLVQLAGHLIVIGHNEYIDQESDWKVGAYEPTTCIHVDIEYLYELDLVKRTVTVMSPSRKIESKETY